MDNRLLSLENEMNRELVSLFNNRIDTLVAPYAGTPAVLAFVGLGPAAASTLLARPDSLTSLMGSSIPMKPDGIDPAALLEKHTVRAARNAIEDSEAPIVCLFEQLKPVSKSLADTYEGRIVLVVNNLFDQEGFYPTALSTQDVAEYTTHFEDESSDYESLPCGRFYASTLQVGDEYLVCPLLDDDWDSTGVEFERVNLFSPAPAQSIDTYHDGLTQVSAPSPAFTRLKMRLSEFEPQDVELLIDESRAQGNACTDDAVSLVSLLLEVAGSLHEIGLSAQANEQEDTREAELLPYLKRYWGPEAKFKQLKFYKDPDRSMALTEVSQGRVAGYAVAQAEAALSGSDDYTDLFVTAPTGAGKSLLFQLPALYLGEKHGALTIVIEPLKALMKDQAEGLRRRGVKEVAVINGDMTYTERTDEYDRVRSGEVSILYLAPELLLASSIDAIVGERTIGLVVVDEAHTVTSWGKDFRPDYWYLGSYLAKVRRSGRPFPIFCLTATAVYGGVDDVVMQTIADLELIRCTKFLGNVRRNDIRFCIQTCDRKEYPGPVDEAKTELAVRRIRKFAELTSGQTLVYCPFRSQVDAIMSQLDDLRKTGKVLGYHAGMGKTYKKEAQERYTNGSCRAMVCTKAWGMGIDVDDVVRVYHYAPTGNISDYIQEIGRAARRSGLEAKAVVDFFRTDANYYRQLYSMSGFTQTQLREVLRKLYSLYWNRPKRTQNMLVSPESFAYLFPDEQDLQARVNKARSALLMVAKDLQERCSYPVLIIAPRASNTKNFVCVEDRTVAALKGRYSAPDGAGYLRMLRKQDPRVIYEPAEGSQNSPVVAKDIGHIYELDSARLWEDHFADYSFADFKRRLFEGEILGKGDGLEPISPRTRLTIMYRAGYEETCQKFDAYVDALEKAFRWLSRSQFALPEFKAELSKQLDGTGLKVDNTEVLLKSFVAPYKGSGSVVDATGIKCVKRLVRDIKDSTASYAIDAKKVQAVTAVLRRALAECVPNEGTYYVVYLNRDRYATKFQIAELLEVLGLAEYENRGGSGADLFVRLNSPSKINAFARDPRYSNAVLKDLNERHKRSSSLITRFFTTDMESKDRWDLVEHYFLGHDEYVAEKLGLGTEDETVGASSVKPRKTKETTKQRIAAMGSLHASIVSIQTPGEEKGVVRRKAILDCSSESEAQQVSAILARVEELGLELPSQGAMLQVESTGEKFCAELAWPRSKVLLFLNDGIGAYATAFQTDWICCMLGTSFDPNALEACLKKEKKPTEEQGE